MANAIYPLYKQSVLDADSNVDLRDGTVKVALVESGYTYSASHQFVSDLSHIVARSGALSTKTVTNGVFDADDLTFSSLTGNAVAALVIYIDTGTDSTSRLVAFIDTGVTGFPLTPNGGDVTITWDSGSNKIFAL